MEFGWGGLSHARQDSSRIGARTRGCYPHAVSSPVRFALALLVFAFGCTKAEPPAPELPEAIPSLHLAVDQDAALLVERLNRLINDGPELRVDVTVSDEALALVEVFEGRAAAAIVHRTASPAEDALAAGQDLVPGEPFRYRTLGEEPVTLLVHESNPVEVVSIEQATGLLSGSIASWTELGGAPEPVERFLREPGTGTHRVVADFLGELRQSPGQTLPHDRAVGTAVAAEPHSLGLGGGAPELGTRQLALRSESGATLLPLAQSGGGERWPLRRPLLLVTRGEDARALKAWLAFVGGAEGKALLEQNGYRPPDEQL